MTVVPTITATPEEIEAERSPMRRRRAPKVSNDAHDDLLDPMRKSRSKFQPPRKRGASAIFVLLALPSVCRTAAEPAQLRESARKDTYFIPNLMGGEKWRGGETSSQMTSRKVRAAIARFYPPPRPLLSWIRAARCSGLDWLPAR